MTRLVKRKYSRPVVRAGFRLAASVLALLCVPVEVNAGDRVLQPVAQSRPERGVVTLAACLRRAETAYPSVREALARVHQAEAQLDEARSAPYSDFSSTAGVALAPTLRGSNIYSPNTDVALTENMALGWQVAVQGTIPLWTFGKITHLVEAARAQVKVKDHEVFKARNELRMSVRRAYYGAQFARDVLSLIRDAISQLDKHIEKLARQVEEEDADDVPLLQMQMHRADLLARETEALQQQGAALAALRLLIGSTEPIDVVDEPLPAPSHQLAPLAVYLSAARLHRPEVNMARAGVLAREAQVSQQRSAYYPDIGLTFSGGWSYAPEITDQLNPFVRDQANYLRYGVALGLKWDLDFLPQSARVAQAQGKLEEMRATESFALGGIATEVEIAYQKVAFMKARYDAYKDAVEYARRWLITVQQGLDVGTYEAKDVVSPAKEYATKRFSLMSSTYDYHVALAGLAMATGWQAVVLQRNQQNE